MFCCSRNNNKTRMACRVHHNYLSWDSLQDHHRILFPHHFRNNCTDRQDWALWTWILISATVNSRLRTLIDSQNEGLQKAVDGTDRTVGIWAFFQKQSTRTWKRRRPRYMCVTPGSVRWGTTTSLVRSRNVIGPTTEERERKIIDTELSACPKY